MVESPVDVDEVFHALSHPTRRDMLARLRGSTLTVGQLAEPLTVSLAAASKHVAVLERAGLVQRTVQGRTHVCRLTPGPLASAAAWLDAYETYWNERLDALERCCSMRTRPPTTPTPRRTEPMAYPAARVQRTLPFPRERVFRAWLDPATMVRWFVDPRFTDGRAEVDPRVGGHYRIFQVDPEGELTGGSESEILELVPNERLVLAWRFAGPNRDEDLSPVTRITVTFAEPRPGETELTVLHEQLDELAAAMPHVAGHVEAGWNDTLDRLAPVLDPTEALA